MTGTDIFKETWPSVLPDVYSTKRYVMDDGTILKRHLCAAVENEAKALMLPFALSVSVGSVLVEPDKNVALDEYFSMADTAMYEMKKKIHEEEQMNEEV